MTSSVETFKGCKILRTAGRIDFESALEFEQSVNALLQGAENRFIIELSEVELLSSAGLRVLLSAVKRATHRNAQLALAAPSLVVRQVFEISHFDMLFKIYPTLSEAVNALGGKADAAAAIEAPQPASAIQPKTPVEERPVMPERGDWPQEPLAPEPVPVAVKPPTPTPPVVPIPPVPTPSERKFDSIPVTPAAMETAVPPIADRRPVSARVSPPPLPTAPPTRSVAEAAAPQQLPANAPRPQGKTPPVPASGRREATYPSVLEVRAEGVSYACKDGDVIGKGGQIARSFFDQVTGLEPRHLLIGQLDGRWFVFTPKTVVNPFIFDGVPLSPGERRQLVYVEHQMEFHGYVFGLRLMPVRRKPGFFARLLGKR
jgi:anti-anti-sigma factor